MKNDEHNTAVVIMAGGVGTRFWPLSTSQKPKQFLKLFDDDKSLLQKSVERVSGIIPNQRILVLTNKAFIDIAAEQLPQIPRANIIGEPMRRDTAAAACLGALICKKLFGNPVIITLTADHMIEPVDLFQRALLSAVRFARNNNALYTFGIQPTYPATSYGYLELGEKVAEDDGIEHFKLQRFKEKPDLETARRYVESGRFRWNSGMFVWTAGAILEEINKHIPSHLEALSEAVKFYGTSQWPEALERAFGTLTAISIDYAVMEKAADVRCVGCAFSWSDVGGWNAIKDYLPRDEAGNCCRGSVISMDSEGNLVFCEQPDESVMLIGVKDLIIVRAGNRTLVTHKDRTEDIKKLVERHLK
ncbi:MAG: mannose-1-phosphate guanylyltransferase [Deltaproteobacteria bacterium]|nr:mannose-1-phosphate guanylyltransferase [Deltaproteobacteria bacterium]MBW1978660.1 mannose-1-phosphate guanylyltransferase [Deltaproteobacteria bacterium]MBW2045892.1 mannose-1-phosphate guanylyltransferase [Deltaproteobacteria bacterium]MBW2301450.1 mannose-1-phosphate guanylyltransferase [Deltaproteobacteria bacterium]